tara:strand:+ start:1944 stop:2144 length:201 start_codon:yes stop_codon:yes gene_type:complete
MARDIITELRNEAEELYSKLFKLTGLLLGDRPEFISETQWYLLRWQKDYMQDYYDVLMQRIEDLKK